jgi:proline iminopeptidase
MLRQVDDHDTFLVTHGSGPPLVTLHGGPGMDHTYFRPWLDPLGQLRKIVYYDLVGNGRSARDVDLGEGMDAWVAEVDAVRASLGHEQIDLFGHSFGTFVALKYALAYPGRVSRLILCSGAAVLDDPQGALARARARTTPDRFDALVRVFSVPPESDEALGAAYRQIMPVYFRRLEPRVADVMGRMAFSARAFGHGLSRCLPTYDVRAQLGHVRTPTLVLSGRHDWLTTPLDGEVLRAGIAGARHVVFEDSGHCPFIEEQARFVETTREFLMVR